MLGITLFGGFNVTWEGKSLPITNTRQVRRLLALLTLHRNKYVNSIWVMDTLGIPDTVLPQSLHKLRECLREQGKERIICRKELIHFDTTGIAVDIIGFEKLIARNTLEALAEAVDLHQGELLMDWTEEDWFAEERENYLVDYCDAVSQLAMRASSGGNFDLAASLYHKRVLAYPEMDSGWALWIEALRDAGNLALAEKAYYQYGKFLELRSQAEGKVFSPSPRVIRIFEKVSNPHPSADAPLIGAVCDGIVNEADAALFLEPVGGAVPISSSYYLVRPEDARVHAALAHRDSFILVRGARQVGKSSLLVRVQDRCRQNGVQVVRTDWQKLSQASLETAPAFLLDLAETFAEELGLDIDASLFFQEDRPAVKGFERYFKKAVLPSVSGSLVWIVDEADRIFDTPYRDDVFAMLRSWHGERANDFTGLWQKLTVVIAYATDAHLFIKNLDQSPFNIGEQFELDDFTGDQVSEMNRRYGAPLKTDAEILRLQALVGGHPYLVRRCLQEMIVRQMNITEVEQLAAQEGGFLNGHLRRLGLALSRDPEIKETLQAWLQRRQPLSQDAFIRLRAAGVVRGQEARNARIRCRLYETYLLEVTKP